MRVLVAFDKFKDSLSARRAGEVVVASLREIHPDWSFDLCPLSDGGEGFAEILTLEAGGSLIPVKVTGPRGGRREAKLGLAPLQRIPARAATMLDLLPGSSQHKPAPVHVAQRPEECIAVVEMAAASGLSLLPRSKRDPWKTSSIGTGQLLRTAAELRVRGVLLGIGGSATHDLGFGALSALGFEFRGQRGGKLRPPCPATWDDLESIEGDPPHGLPPVKIACDVSNPLLGPRGAATVYGPQKGLRSRDLPRIEALTEKAARLLCDHCHADPSLMETPGAGAAGGIGFGLTVAAGARLVSGNELVDSWLRIEERIRGADLIITGEGRFDRSSLEGKGPGALVLQATALGKPAVVLAGSLGDLSEQPELLPTGVRTRAITPKDMPMREALARTAELLSAAVVTLYD